MRARDLVSRVAGIRILFLRAVSLFKTARGPVEVFSVLCFILRYVESWVAPKVLRTAEATIRLQGAVYRVGLRGGESATFREIYLDRQYDKLPDFIPRYGWTVLDIGANVGLYAVQSARRGAVVYAFEPSRASYERLVYNVIDNGLSGRVTTSNCALGSRPGRGVVVSDGLTIHGQVQPIGDRSRQVPTAVEMTTLDRLVWRFGLARIDLMKIDVEGAEVEVLGGAIDALKAVDRIIVEYHSTDLLEKVDQFLLGCGYSLLLREETYPGQALGLLYYAKRPTPVEGLAGSDNAGRGGSALDPQAWACLGEDFCSRIFRPPNDKP